MCGVKHIRCATLLNDIVDHLDAAVQHSLVICYTHSSHVVLHIHQKALSS